MLKITVDAIQFRNFFPTSMHSLNEAEREAVICDWRLAPLGLFFGFQVVEIAKKLAKPANGGQKLVAVAQLVLGELTRSSPAHAACAAHS